ncbi:hypothetical protein H1R20_g6260, partial [Candolleomyces eurysporus]
MIQHPSGLRFVFISLTKGGAPELDVYSRMSTLASGKGECPDFAENGSCSTKGCKLPHVIRANRGRKTATTAKKEDETKGMDVDSSLTVPSTDPSNAKETPTIYAEDGKMGDEFISLTFHESEEEEEDEEDEDEDDEEEEEENEEEEEDEEESEESSVVETVT